MRLTIAIAAALLSVGAAHAQTCFRDCLSPRLQSDSDDLQIKDAARACKVVCEDKAKDDLAKAGLLDKLTSCKAEPLTDDDMKKVRSASPSYYVQSNVFIWDMTNPFDDRVLTKIEVSAQNMDLNDMQFTGGGVAPPSSPGIFVVPSFFDGYPAVRFAAKVQKIWACPVK